MTTTQPSPLPDFLYGTAWKEDRTATLTELALRTGFRAIDLFLETKFTYQRGRDHRLPYDHAAGLSVQVAPSMTGSLEHLGTDYVDSYILHGPSSSFDWTDADAEVWEAMRKRARCRAYSSPWCE